MPRIPLLLALCLTPLLSVYVAWRGQAMSFGPTGIRTGGPVVGTVSDRPSNARDPADPESRHRVTPGSDVRRNQAGRENGVGRPAAEPPTAGAWEAWSQLSLRERQRLVQPQTILEGVAAESTVPHQVLAWDDVHLALMSAGGTLRFVPWRSTDDLRRVSGAWQPLTPTEVAAQLAAEFGDAYQIRGSAEFLVVQPRTAQRDWARSMQQFYGNIQTYCAGRQIRFQAPRFPLVAIVLPNRQTMLAYAARRQEAVRPHFLAYYGLNTNRIVMVDPSSPRSDSRTPSGSSEAALNLETVFHETFHQVAFNSGLHRRTLPPPLWVSEGMATAFETAGMADHQRSRTLRDRLHRTQCQLFKDFARRPDFGPTLASLIASDELFQARPTEAYAIAWAMAFYWMEQSPQAFSDYLERLKRGATFTVPSPQQRESDFQALSRCTLPEFQQRLINYYDRLP